MVWGGLKCFLVVFCFFGGLGWFEVMFGGFWWFMVVCGAF